MRLVYFVEYTYILIFQKATDLCKFSEIKFQSIFLKERFYREPRWRTGRTVHVAVSCTN